MAGKNRGSASGLNSELRRDLFQKSRKFSFQQMIRMLKRFSKASNSLPLSDENILANIRVRPKLDLGFPAADIDRIEMLPNKNQDKKQDKYLITANMLGLYGTSSPLPTFYTEELIQEAAQDESVSRDFIDIFNQRLFELLYQCQGKYNQFLQIREEKNIFHLERLFCLLGLGEKEFRQTVTDKNSYSLLRYIGLLTQFPRSASGLITLLRDALNGVKVEIIPCVKRRAVIPSGQKLALGLSCCRLGKNSYLGEEISDRMGKFRICIGPLEKKEFEQFSPGHKTYDKVVFLTNFYLSDPLAYDLELIMAGGQTQTVCLGDPSSSNLGMNSWVFSGKKLAEVRTLFSPVK